MIDQIKNTPPENPNAEAEKEKHKPQIVKFFDENDTDIKMKIRKPSKIAPKYVFVFDDMSAQMKKSSSVKELVKQNRHYLSKVIISSQYVTDLSPDTRAMIDIWLLLGDQNDEKLKVIYEFCDPVVEYDTFKQMFEDATKEKYHFFFIDKNNGQYRKDFNTEYIINK